MISHPLNSVLIGTEIWYQRNPVPDFRDTPTRNPHHENGVDLWLGFLELVSRVILCVTSNMGNRKSI